jgi:hypothetical protein
LDSEAGVDMFVNMYPQLDPSVVLPLLCSFRPAFGAAYLQKILDKGAERSAYEQELALLYIHQLMDNSDATPQQRVADDLRDLVSNIANNIVGLNETASPNATRCR